MEWMAKKDHNIQYRTPISGRFLYTSNIKIRIGYL